MYGGDEVNAVVVDLGSASVKAGYAGEDTPKAVFPSSIGVVDSTVVHANGVQSELGSSQAGSEGQQHKPGQRDVHVGHTDKRKLYVGLAALGYRRDHMEVVSPFKQGAYDDFSLIEALLEHAFRDRLGINTQDHPMLLAEPSFNTKEAREKMVELLFEKHSPPAAFIAKNAVLSSFAASRQTSLVVDSGHQGTVVTAVHDGYVLQRSILQSPLGGQVLSQAMQRSVESRGVKIQPRYSFKRIERAPQQFEVQPVDSPTTTDSYQQYCIEQIAADIKESICRVSDSAFDADENANIPTVTYELPDGQEIQIGPDRFAVPEIIFNPGLLSRYDGLGTLKSYDGSDLQALPLMVAECINKCDVDIRRELYGGVILTGGTSLFTQMRDRLERELSDIAPQTAKVKVISPANSMERRFSVWIGGSILASLGSFQQMWMSKQEYEEHGAALMHRKAP